MIIIVSGLPRSGTSLMMQMLEAAGVEVCSDDARPADASNPRGYFELAAVKATGSDTGWVESAEGSAVKVIHALLAPLPRDHNYRVVLMKRSLDEVIDSQDRMLARLGQPPMPMARDRLEIVLRNQLEQAESLMEGLACFDVLPVNHGDLIRNPLAAAKRVEAFLDLEGRAEAMAACVDKSLHRFRG